MKYTDIKPGQLLLAHYVPSYSRRFNIAGAELVEVLEVGVGHDYRATEGGWTGYSVTKHTDQGVRVRKVHPEDARPKVTGQSKEDAVAAAEEPYVTRALLLHPYDGESKEKWDEAQARRRMHESKAEARAAANRQLVHDLNDYLPTEWRWGVDESGAIRVDNIEGRLRAILAALNTGALRERPKTEEV